MENAFYFNLNTLLVLGIFQFFFSISDHVGKILVKKDRGNFKIYDIINWITNNCNTNIAR